MIRLVRLTNRPTVSLMVKAAAKATNQSGVGKVLAFCNIGLQGDQPCTPDRLQREDRAEVASCNFALGAGYGSEQARANATTVLAVTSVAHIGR